MKGKAQTMAVAGSPGLSFFHSTQFNCETLVPVFRETVGKDHTVDQRLWQPLVIPRDKVET